MNPSRLFLPLAAACLALATLAAGLDLHKVETQTLVIYTTPALQEFLERVVLPEFTRDTGLKAVPVYMTASEEYYRVRLAEQRPEADVFVHASPLFLEKGYHSGIVEPMDAGIDLGPGNQSRPVPGGRIWYAFAWSPLVEVHRPGEGPVDLATDDGKFGFAHPLLSNNGVYNVLFFEALSPAAGQAALDRTVVQPVNARATIGGIADRSYDLTLGYEAVGKLYQSKGAKIEMSVPVLANETVTTPVLFSVALVRNHPHAPATEFVKTFFQPEVQAQMASSNLRPMLAGAPQPDAFDLSGVRVIDYDWAEWEALEGALDDYEVKG
ncbi:MAG TPA: substrate-binding domain-containing protein [Candidatus Thermoplasmatota archaeon]|nr:substrate-binding domain-containing protein [Candidatus Thermoplasmatota archaeon]